MSIDVLSLGDILVEIMRTEVERPLDRPAEFVGPFPSGAPAIFIDAAARLGARTAFIGVVGDDGFGDCCVNRLRADGVDVSAISVAPGYTTGIAFVGYFQDGSRKFIYHLRYSAAAQINPDKIDPAFVSRARYLHIMGSALAFNESSRDACYRAMQIVKEAGGRITLDPNLRPEMLPVEEIRAICQPVIESAYAVLPSGAEAQLVTGAPTPDEACRALLGRGVQIVALKQGAAGSTIYTRDGVVSVPSFPVTEVDPTGAGDCYGAAFVVGLLRGWDIERIARYANAVGALAVTKKGPMEGAPTEAEVEALLTDAERR